MAMPIQKREISTMRPLMLRAVAACRAAKDGRFRHLIKAYMQTVGLEYRRALGLHYPYTRTEEVSNIAYLCSVMESIAAGTRHPLAG